MDNRHFYPQGINHYRLHTRRMMQTKIPPLGIIPKTLWIEDRLRKLEEAILRYVQDEWPVPPEWIAERAEHIGYLNGVYNGTGS